MQTPTADYQQIRALKRSSGGQHQFSPQLVPEGMMNHTLQPSKCNSSPAQCSLKPNPLILLLLTKVITITFEDDSTKAGNLSPQYFPISVLGLSPLYISRKSLRQEGSSSNWNSRNRSFMVFPRGTLMVHRQRVSGG